MGWFDGESDYRGDSSSHRRKASPKRHSSGGAGNIFGMGDARHNSSRSSFFGIPNRSTSSYKRSPRTNYLKRMYAKLRRLLRDLLYYLKKHPMKVFMLVIMPLITGGALTGLLARFGIRLPGGIEKLFGGMAGGMGGSRPGGFGSGGYGGGRMGGGGGFGGSGGGLGGLGNMAAAVGGVGGAMNIAKMFL